MKHLMKFAALAAIVLPMMVACGGEKPENTKNFLNGPTVNFAEIVGGKLILGNSLFNGNQPFSFDVTYQSNGVVYYNGEESRILTIGEAKVSDLNEGKSYAFPVTVNPPLDTEDAEFTLVFGVNYSDGTQEYQASRLTIIRKGLESDGIPQGALTGKFSLGGGGQYYFAKGNLEYDSLLNQFSFAEVQYKGEKGYLGQDRYVSGFPMTPYYKNETELIFALQYNYPDLSIQGAEASDDNNYWFIPTAEQWDFLLYKRENAEKLRGFYVVNEELNPGGQYGLIILPDNYLEVAAEKGWDVTSLGNTYLAQTEDDLKLFESRGALILPPFGNISAHILYSDIPLDESRAILGAYWTSSQQDEGEGKLSTIALLLNDVKGEENGLNLVRVHQDMETRGFCIRMAYQKIK